MKMRYDQEDGRLVVILEQEDCQRMRAALDRPTERDHQQFLHQLATLTDDAALRHALGDGRPA